MSDPFRAISTKMAYAIPRYREQPETFHFLEAKSNVPLKQEFKPAVTLLSRKPQVESRPSESPVLESATARIGQLGLNHENDFDDSEENNDRPVPSPEERQAMALRNREEKQRKYEEVRERLFGSPSAPTSGSSSRSATPPKDGRGKGKSRGSGRNNRNGRDSSAASGNSRQLYDPGQNPNSAAVYLQREERQPTGEQQQTRQDFRNSRGEHHWRGVFKTGPKGAGSS